MLSTLRTCTIRIQLSGLLPSSKRSAFSLAALRAAGVAVCLGAALSGCDSSSCDAGQKLLCDEECDSGDTGTAMCVDGQWGECLCETKSASESSSMARAAVGGTGEAGAGGSKSHDGSGGSAATHNAGGSSAPRSFGGAGGMNDNDAGPVEPPEPAPDSVGCVAPDSATVKAANATCANTVGDDDFVKLDDGTAVACKKDQNFGAVWQLNAGMKKYDYQGAQDYCSKLNLAGRRWRVPCYHQMLNTTGSSTDISHRTVWDFGSGPAGEYWLQQREGKTNTSEVFEIGGSFPQLGTEVSVSLDAYVRCVSTEKP